MATTDGDRFLFLGTSTIHPSPYSCAFRSASKSAGYTVLTIGLLVVITASNALNLLLRRLGQPRIVSDFIVAMATMNCLGRAYMDQHYGKTLEYLAQFTFAPYMFVLGLEMEPRSLLKRPGSDTIIAYAGVLSTVILAGISYPFFKSIIARDIPDGEPTISLFLGLAVALANTASPLLTRLTAELKIDKSEIGHLAVNAGITTDMVSTIAICVGLALHGPMVMLEGNIPCRCTKLSFMKMLRFLVVISLLVVAARKVVRPILGWLNKRNPEEKQIKGADVAVAVAAVCGLVYAGSKMGYDLHMGAFFVGLALPWEGRIPRFLTGHIKFFLGSVILPAYLCLSGYKTDFKNTWGSLNQVNPDNPSDVKTFRNWSWAALVYVVVVGLVGKVSGVLVAGLRLGLQWPEAVALGLLLNIKGHFLIFLATRLHDAGAIGASLHAVVMVAAICMVAYVPLVVGVIVRLARRRARQRMLGIQWHNPAHELKVVVGMHGPQNLPMAVNFTEAMRPGHGSMGLTVYAQDLIKLTDRVAAALVRGEGDEPLTVADESVVEMREQMGAALEACVRGDGDDALVVRRMLIVSALSDMHHDICGAAEDALASIIIMPFHKTQTVGGEMDAGDHDYRLVNQKVLRHAPCSVGIMVDRSVGMSNQMRSSDGTRKVAVVFIGGPDDWEALALAGRMLLQPSIRLTVIHFLPEIMGPGNNSMPAGVSRKEPERRADDWYLADFYEKHVVSERVAYVEKRVENGAEMMAALRSMERQYHLFVVGLGMDRESVLTAGMEEWSECPELGPVGDVLAGSDFSVTASVLIVQQHDNRKAFDAIDEEFLPT